MSLKNDHYDEIDDDNNDSKDENDNICFNNLKKLKTENKGKNAFAGCYGSFGLAQARGL